MKKTRSRKSRDTVPLKSLYFTLGYSISNRWDHRCPGTFSFIRLSFDYTRVYPRLALARLEEFRELPGFWINLTTFQENAGKI